MHSERTRPATPRSRTQGCAASCPSAQVIGTAFLLYLQPITLARALQSSARRRRRAARPAGRRLALVVAHKPFTNRMKSKPHQGHESIEEHAECMHPKPLDKQQHGEHAGEPAQLGGEA